MVPTARKFEKDMNKNFPVHWFKDNIVATHIMNSLHMIFPDGERFFIRSVQAFNNQLSDAGLKERVKGFIAQEVQHGKSHEEFWQTLRDQGLEPDQFRDIYVKSGYEGIEPFLVSLFGQELALSTTVALEHWTAVLAEKGLTAERVLDGMPEEMAQMLDWHAAEEIEHKSVAFDVLKEVDDDTMLRMAGMLIGTLGLWIYGAIGTVHFLSKDNNINFFKLLTDSAKVGIFGAVVLPDLIKEVIEYTQSDFHPDDNDNYHLAERVFAQQADNLRNLKKAG